MKTNKLYKIMVLTDLKRSSSTVLKNAVGLAKMIGGEIEVFHVSRPSDTIASENQLSAMRALNRKHATIDKKMTSLTDPIAKEFVVPIRNSFVFGNIKTEIRAYMDAHRPDIVVLGKRKTNPFVLGDNITELILNVHNGPILISTNKDSFATNKEFSLASLRSSGTGINLEFSDDLIKYAQAPLRAFTILKKTGKVTETEKSTLPRTIEYVFEQNESSIKNLANYMSKNNIDVLSIDRKANKNSNEARFSMPELTSVIKTLNVNLLVTGK
ncbi:MAG: universal stress protein [Flavobacteriaceae bacterium]